LCGHCAQLWRETIFRRFHQGAVERRTDGQRHDTLGPQLFRACARALNGGLCAGNHNLPSAVQVRRRHNFSERSLRARLRDSIRIETKDRRHCAGPDRYGLLHVAPSTSHDPHGIAKGKRSGCYVG
jgi:hypothetical protein